jgi:uncharacterized protein
VQAADRIKSLDVLRGVGVLGMLAVHIQLFAFPSLARWNPTAYGDLTGLNWWAWLASTVLADGKFITIFAMLLGVSIVMLGKESTERARSAWRGHMRRMLVLLFLGVLHAYLVWYGDMLVPLGLSGMVVFFARRRSAGTLLALGMLIFTMGSALPVALTWSTAHADPAALAAWKAQWVARPETIAREIAQYRGGWAEQMAHRVPTALETQTSYFVTHLFWQIAGLMLIGMGLFKAGVLSATRTRAFYVRMGVLGFAIGVLLNALGIWRSFATGWDLLDFVLVSQQLHYWGNLFVALGWTAVVMLLCQRGWPLRSLEAVGRMALTNYLLQSVICTTIFYGHGLGLFGRVDRAAQLAIVIAIWAFQMVASRAWLSHFAVGPVEWVTRWLVFGRRPSLLRTAPAVART